MVIMEELTNIVVVVTRYFGGVKLGTGGLVRAYTGTAKKAIENSGIGEVVPMVNLVIIFEYSLLDKLKHMGNSLKVEGSNLYFEVKDLMFGEQVRGTLVYQEEFEEKIVSALANLTGDSHTVVARDTTLSKIKIS